MFSSVVEFSGGGFAKNISWCHTRSIRTVVVGVVGDGVYPVASPYNGQGALGGGGLSCMPEGGFCWWWWFMDYSMVPYHKVV